MSETGKISDGYHTFDELYEHRNLLFAHLVEDNLAHAWVSKNHHDGTSFDGWFIAGIETRMGQISYHLPMKFWDLFIAMRVRPQDTAPEWDGHTSDDVLQRLKEWAEWKGK